MEENEKHNREKLIKNWFYLVKNNEINDSILVLMYVANLENKLTNLLRKYNIYLFISSQPLNYMQLNSQNHNSILLIDSTKNFLNIEQIKLKLLFVPAISEFYKDSNSYINLLEFTDIQIDNSLKYLFWLEKDIPLDLIRGNDVDLKNYILKRAWIMNSIQSHEKINIDTALYTDVKMLSENQLLTSRLAIIIYKTSKLEINANFTKIGRYWHEVIGTKSKTFNTNMLIKRSPNNIVISHDLIQKNFKAYDLNINESEMTIRMEIANNLLSYNVVNLSLEMIAKATKLPLQTIKQLNSQFKL